MKNKLIYVVEQDSILSPNAYTSLCGVCKACHVPYRSALGKSMQAGNAYTFVVDNKAVIITVLTLVKQDKGGHPAKDKFQA